ncbi:MAG TPA: FeoB-associated Cys-rich membrane protein [Pyrinomonadaceae bacterium]|nr:FeoB-associated Cys-rich membrane protein [Pyrinomonadaceae bacterium]
MDIQLIIVGIVILAAAAYATSMFTRKSRSMVSKSACADDCGCSTRTKTPKTAN